MFNTSVIHIEISSKCMLKCPRCPRTELKPDNLNQEISLEQFRMAFPTDTLANISEIIFCGDIGDPIYAKDFLPVCRYIKTQSNTNIHIVTNGSYKNSDWWTELAQILTATDRITFSIDGWDFASNNQYRVNADFESIIQGIKTFRAQSNAVLIWSTIYFSFNEAYMDRIQSLAQSLGMDYFQTVKSTKFDHQYSINGTDRLKPQNVSSTGVYEKHQIALGNRVWTIKDYSKQQHAWAKCLNAQKELFVNVQGLVFPCAWFNTGYQTNQFVQANTDKLSIFNRSLAEVLSDPVWTELVKSFDTNPLAVCKIKCRHGS